jgi:hypothetical protein
MSIQDFRTQLETGKEKNSLILALARLSRLGSLKDLVLAATTESGGWAYWTDVSSDPTSLVEVGA